MIGPDDIRAAYARITPHVRRTPLMRIDARDFGITLDQPLTLKLEFLQHTGSFKPRGAFNNLLSRKVPAAGVAAASGGNHGAAVAYAAQQLGHKATIFVPDVSAPVKIARIKSYGADTRVGGARYADALEACEAFIAQSGALSVHAYDAAETIAGQGSVGLEWQEDARELDTVLVAVGGGGLIAGIAAWYGRRVKVVGVEPEGSRALHASLEAGGPVDVTVESVAADSLGARNTGQLVYDIARAQRGSRRARRGRCDYANAAPAVGSPAHRGGAGRRGRARSADQRPLRAARERTRRRAAVWRECGRREARNLSSFVHVEVMRVLERLSGESVFFARVGAVMCDL